MKKKMKLILPLVLVLVVGGAAYKMVLAPKPAQAKKPKIEGHLVALQPAFVVNLADGRYGKLTVSVLVTHLPVAAHGGSAGPTLEQNDAVRAVVTDTLTGIPADELISRHGRTQLLKHVLHNLHDQTDEHVKKVYFTDIAVQ
jgi:flagellar basal body-associated protein FliL